MPVVVLLEIGMVHWPKHSLFSSGGKIWEVFIIKQLYCVGIFSLEAWEEI